jgi:hypothetical protein
MQNWQEKRQAQRLVGILRFKIVPIQEIVNAGGRFGRDIAIFCYFPVVSSGFGHLIFRRFASTAT